MKRLIAVLFCLFAAAPLLAFNDNKGLVDEVIRMSRARVADDTIIEYILHTSGKYYVSVDDVIAMRDAEVSSRVARVVIEESRAREPEAERTIAGPDRNPTPPWTQFYDPWWFMPRMYKNLPSKL